MNLLGFNPLPLRPKGSCCHLRLSVCRSVPINLVNKITQSVYAINPPNLQGGFKTGLEGFGQYPVFTAVFTGKYRPGKNRFWTPKVGKTGKNTTWLYNQFHISIKGSIWLWNTLIKDMRILSSVGSRDTVSDFASSFEFTNDVKNMKLTFELLSACCTPVPATTKHVQSTWENHFTI